MDDFAFARNLGEMGRGLNPFAVATIVRTFGSSLGKPGFKIIVSHEGEVLQGTLGGGCPEGPIIATALEAIKEGVPALVRVYLEDVDSSIKASVERVEDEIHVETDCGGGMDIYIEPYLPKERLVIVGQGGRDEIEDHLVKLGRMLDFHVVVVDHAPDLSTQADELLDDLDFDFNAFEWSSSDSVVLLAKSERTVGILADLSGTGVRYVGLLASGKRARKNLKALRDRGIPEDYLKRVRTPIGVDMGAESPAEIALSIMAEVVASRHGRILPGKGKMPTGDVRQK